MARQSYQPKGGARLAQPSLVSTRKSGGGNAAVFIIIALLAAMAGLALYLLGAGAPPPKAPAAAPQAQEPAAAANKTTPTVQKQKKASPANKAQTPPPVIKETPVEPTPAQEPQPEPTPDEQPVQEIAEDEDPEEQNAEPEEEPAEDDASDSFVTQEDTPEAMALLEKKLSSALEAEDYDGLRTDLRRELEAAHPGLFEQKPDKRKEAEADADAELPPSPYAGIPSAGKLRVKGKVMRRALASYYCLELLLAEQSPADLDKDFMGFLLTEKHHPAVAFFKGITQKKVAPETAAEMLGELRSTFEVSPQRAYRSIAPLTASANKLSIKKYYPHEKKEIDKKIAEILKTRPSNGADKAQQEAINLTNVYRFISGVAPSLKYDKEFGKQAEDAAAACAAAGHISHDLGHYTDACNLHSGMDARVKSVPGYIEDPGGPNREARGHRNWALDPAAAKVAFGQKATFHAMRVMDTSCTIKQKGAYSYPGRGFFPVRYLHGNGWSYHSGSHGKVGENPTIEMWALPRTPKKTVTASDLRSAKQISIPAIFPHGNYIVFEPDYDDKSFKRNKNGQLEGVYFIRVTWKGFKDEYIVEFY